MKQLALGFDFDHTLGVDNRVEVVIGSRLLRELADERGIGLAQDAAERQIERALSVFRNGHAGVDDALAATARELGVDPAAFVDRFRSEVVACADEFIRPLPGTRELLTWLREQSVPYAVLTNGWSPLQERKAALIGLDAPVLVSETIGARKPLREAFAHLSLLFPSRADLWYVGDDPIVDVGGAVDAGLRAVWLGGPDQEYPSDAPRPNAIIRRPDELIAVIAPLIGLPSR